MHAGRASLLLLWMGACVRPPAVPDPADLGPMECSSTMETNLDELRKEIGADAIAVVTWIHGSPDKASVSGWGKPCPDGGACAAAWEKALRPDERRAAMHERNPELPRYVQYAVAKGATVTGDLRALLVPVDGPWKAQFLITLMNGGRYCGEHVIRAVEGGYEFIQRRTYGQCDPTTEIQRVRVDRDGKIHPVGPVVTEQEKGVCS